MGCGPAAAYRAAVAQSERDVTRERTSPPDATADGSCKCGHLAQRCYDGDRPVCAHRPSHTHTYTQERSNRHVHTTTGPPPSATGDREECSSCARQARKVREGGHTTAQLVQQPPVRSTTSPLGAQRSYHKLPVGRSVRSMRWVVSSTREYTGESRQTHQFAPLHSETRNDLGANNLERFIGHKYPTKGQGGTRSGAASGRRYAPPEKMGATNRSNACGQGAPRANHWHKQNAARHTPTHTHGCQWQPSVVGLARLVTGSAGAAVARRRRRRSRSASPGAYGGAREGPTPHTRHPIESPTSDLTRLIRSQDSLASSGTQENPSRETKVLWFAGAIRAGRCHLWPMQQTSPTHSH